MSPWGADLVPAELVLPEGSLAQAVYIFEFSHSTIFYLNEWTIRDLIWPHENTRLAKKSEALFTSIKTV